MVSTLLWFLKVGLLGLTEESCPLLRVLRKDVCNLSPHGLTRVLLDFGQYDSEQFNENPLPLFCDHHFHDIISDIIASPTFL